MLDAVHSQIAGYYSKKIQHHGPIPQGVDWGNESAQRVRFRQLLRLIERPDGSIAGTLSINDLGCGYGALLDHLDAQGLQVDYMGVDLSEAMIAAAQQSFLGRGQFVVGAKCPRQAQYSVASGLFNVKGDVPGAEWEAFVRDTITELDASSSHGFAFNCLTSYADEEKRRSDLYYGNPCEWFDWCKRHFSPQVALLHDYGLYDFTVLVRK